MSICDLTLPVCVYVASICDLVLTFLCARVLVTVCMCKAGHDFVLTLVSTCDLVLTFESMCDLVLTCVSTCDLALTFESICDLVLTFESICDLALTFESLYHLVLTFLGGRLQPFLYARVVLVNDPPVCGRQSFHHYLFLFWCCVHQPFVSVQIVYRWTLHVVLQQLTHATKIHNYYCLTFTVRGSSLVVRIRRL